MLMTRRTKRSKSTHSSKILEAWESIQIQSFSSAYAESWCKQVSKRLFTTEMTAEREDQLIGLTLDISIALSS